MPEQAGFHPGLHHDRAPHAQAHAPIPPLAIRWSVGDWAWFIAKNILGWTLIVFSFPLGMMVPGPGGIPIFLIGFALITFPGKRNLTARVMRGRPVHRENRGYRIFVIVFSLLAPFAFLSWLRGRWVANEPVSIWFLAYLCGVVLLWIFGLRGVHIINAGLALMPKVRRKIRPWMRRKGLDLLPPRRRRRFLGGHPVNEPDEGILEIHARHHDRIRRYWDAAKPWLRRIIGLAITLAIFYWMLKPVVQKWDQVREPLSRYNWGYFALGAAMFALFLFAFRVIIWWKLLDGMGHRLPLATTTRIFSTGELARYLPGWIWQVWGRVYLIKPYGVTGTVCSTSQILELTIFLLANILVAIACLLWLGGKMNQEIRPLFWSAMALVPVLLLILHPRVFYGVVNKVMRRLGKPQMPEHFRKRELLVLGIWAMLGLLWQSLAIWVVVQQPLGLQFTKWWVVAGAYCLAWTAGFLAFWAPGGLGVREAVLVLALELAVPPAVREQIADQKTRFALFALIGVLLRLWATAGELLLTAISYALDYRGALGRPDAPGWVGKPVPLNTIEMGEPKSPSAPRPSPAPPAAPASQS